MLLSTIPCLAEPVQAPSFPLYLGCTPSTLVHCQPGYSQLSYGDRFQTVPWFCPHVPRISGRGAGATRALYPHGADRMPAAELPVPMYGVPMQQPEIGVATAIGLRIGRAMAAYLQEIHTTLDIIARQASLWLETNFAERLQALERLEWCLPDCFELELDAARHPEVLARLQRRAADLWQDLIAVNDRLFHRLRGQIVSGSITAAALHQMVETYVGQASYNDAYAYDNLDVFVDGLLGLGRAPQETQAIVPGMIGYQATPARLVLDLIARTNPSAHDVFYDIGSGLGRVVLLAGLLSPAQAKGIEFEPAYCAYAQQLAQHLHLSHVTFLNVDARQAEYTDGTVFFLYTPCIGPMLQDVLDALHVQARTRPITLVTYGPCTAHVAQQPWLHPQQAQTVRAYSLTLFSSV